MADAMIDKKTFMVRLEALGHFFFYVALRLFGHTGGRVLLVPVVFVYVVCSRKIHRTTKHYLKRRFPDENGWTYWWLTYKNVLSFGQVLVDRGWLGLIQDAALDGECVEYDALIELINEGKGLVLLTGHVGNWQSALARLGGLPVTVHALMQYDQQAAAKHFFDLQSTEPPFEIIDADSEFGGMIEAAAALGRGEVVTIMGDRFVKGSSSVVDFLGDPVRIPNGAYQLASSVGAPVAILLAAKTGRKSYQLKLWDAFYPEYEKRDERDKMLRDCSTRYIKAIEEYLKLYPCQWYNFYYFWQQ